jgi:hypothetical protein
MFQFPRFAFVSYVFRHKYLHLISANPRLAPHSPFRAFRVRDSKLQRSKVGFPIRKSADQSLFAAPHGLSQRTTSFIASQRQGIHRTPLRHLIALIIEDRSERFGSSFDLKDHLLRTYPRVLRSSETHAGRSLPKDRDPRGRLDMFPLHYDRQRAHPATDRREPWRTRWKRETFRTRGSALVGPLDRLVEPDGIEPTTSCLQSTRSPN